MNISGSPADRRDVLGLYAASNEPVDVFVGDWMSELNMPSRAYSVANGLGVGYEETFLEALEPALEDLARRRIKLAANGGTVATKDLFDVVVKLVEKKGLNLNVAWVEGDLVMDQVNALRKEDTKFKHISTGEILDDWEYEPLFAQCYLGGMGIAEAFRSGADIVICGRVADAAPIVGGAAWFHGWSRTDFDQLARSLIAGHLIECSTYVTGGNYTGFKSLDWGHLDDLGYPIAEIGYDGDVIITKPDETGGVVNVETCKEQLLYEIQGKWYLNSDVTAVIDQAKFEQVGKDRVRLSGVTGRPPPRTTKVGLTAFGGYKAEVHWALVGLDIAEKVKMMEIQIKASFGKKRLEKFTTFSLTTYGSVPTNPTNMNAATVDLRLLVQARNKEDLSDENFARPAFDIIMSSFPAATFHPDKRTATPLAYQEYFPTLISQPTVTVHFSKPGLESISISPPEETIEHPEYQPSYETANPIPLEAFGPTVKAPLGYRVLARAGDKGSNCNVGFFVRDETEWPWLRSLLTTDTFIELMAEEYQGQVIDRMEFPNLWAVHFLVKDFLDRGVTANATYDVLGKPCANCRDFGATCEYLPPKSMMHRDQQKSVQAVQAVEDRVAELESILRREGIGPHGEKRKQRVNEELYTCSPSMLEMPAEKRWKPSPTPSEQRSDASSPMPKRMAVSTVVEILRDLSIEASGGYIGASSQITMGRMISSIVQAREYTISSSIERGWEHLSPKSANTASVSPSSGLDFSQVPPEIADKLLHGYVRHISTRWPILQTPFVRLLHAERYTLSDAFFTSVLHLIYAIGGRFLETTGETGDFFPEHHFDQALKNLDDILRLHDIRSVQFLLLLSIYSLRSPKGPGAWTYTGLAMRTCIDLGMHRKTQKSRSLLEHEMRKRVFWTCYCLDRQVSIILGRPFAISDRDIDVQLPLDVDESCEDLEVLERTRVATDQGSNSPASKSTSMTGFIYICKLRQIESDIQQSIYRVDQSAPATEAEAERFIAQLETMPTDATTTHPESMIVDNYDYYMVYYYKCLRFLLHPVVLSTELSDTKYLLKCAEACGGVCRTYKKLHQSVPVGFSVMALHSIFLAGLTLIYCAWAAPKEVFNIGTSNDMNACSIVLYIITERWPGARKYRDLYESIKQMVLESIEEGQYEPRRAITSLRPGLHAALRAIDHNDDSQGEFSASAMVTNMAGGSLPPDSEAVQASSSNYAAHTPGTQSHFNLVMPLDFHDSDGFVDTMFATPTSDWLVA
ncbi:putative Transcription factor domain-containing protein [Seiridium unicorne]|uniref:Transcription factor domain-containing protein n=1 Tax=Seiridium unicorne TaxID=138068 RepID=A0ABR2UR33_9PEZI